MIKIVYLLRHCSTRDTELGINGSRTDTPLSEKGLTEARSLIPIIAKFNYDLIIVSPLSRTKQTVKPYLDTFKKPPKITIEPLTIERDLGSLTNTVQGDGKIPENMTASGKTKTEWTPPNGESTVDVYKRAQQFFAKIKSYSENNILICGHQNFLRCLELTIIKKKINDDNFYSDNPARLKPGEIRRYTFITSS